MKVFIKHNHSKYADSLLKELEGLKTLENSLKENPYLHIPKVFEVTSETLSLELIDQAYPSKELSRNLGIGLASLHKQKFEFYGLEYDNHIGLNPQRNVLLKDWGQFFITYRLLYQINLIKDHQLQKMFQEIIEKNTTKLQEFLNNSCSHPSLVHGDLWSGNVLYEKEKVYLIDPAVYYADKEVDIAMSEMFGGFESEFYKAYDETYPLSSEYERKKIIYNLYHYLNHYNLFGSGYLSPCEEGLSFIENL